MILCIRISSFFGWFDAWLQSLDFDSETNYEMIKYNSMFFYCAIIFAPIPGLLVDLFDRLMDAAYGRQLGVCCAMAISSFAAAMFSFLSGKPDYAANTAAIFFAVVARTFTYGSYAVFVEAGNIIHKLSYESAVSIRSHFSSTNQRQLKPTYS